ncbi:succinate fumarate mitochondrial transporter [Nannochloropsis oceanica]
MAPATSPATAPAITPVATPTQKATSPPKKKTMLDHLVAGGAAGFVESSVCHPLDTIKTRMQLRQAGGSTHGLFMTGARIIQKESFLALYKGLTAVYMGIVPKMAVRFSSFEAYKGYLANADGEVSPSATFLAGLGSGVTEAILVVTPAEYRNVLQTAFLVAKEEGISALYKGVVPTVMRQGINQAVNFTTYQAVKSYWLEKQQKKDLLPWESMLFGGLSGGLGPLVNNPLDVVKTRLQKQRIVEGQLPKYRGIGQAIPVIVKEEGVLALWKGIAPRLMRIMPGQAITFMTYEFVSKHMAGVDRMVDGLVKKTASLASR